MCTALHCASVTSALASNPSSAACLFQTGPRISRSTFRFAARVISAACSASRWSAAGPLRPRSTVAVSMACRRYSATIRLRRIDKQEEILTLPIL